MYILKNKSILFFILILFGCSKQDDPPADKISLISITVDGAALIDGATNIPIDKTISISFSAVIDPNSFADNFSITSNVGALSFPVTYTNSNSKANIEVQLNYATTYTLRLENSVIGANGEALDQALNITFSTQESNIITSTTPCVSTAQCLQTLAINGSTGSGSFSCYSNYQLNAENTSWESLTQAVIVIHGASHNADDYFSYLTNTLNAEGLSESTILIAPLFRSEATTFGNDYFWSNLGWRDGKLSNNSNKISSFEVIDKIIDMLADEVHFPVLEQVVITGQSSGGRFTHIFAPSNKSHSNYPNIQFNYVVSESQYFYYPDGRRIDEITNQLYIPMECGGYEIWPFGFDVKPEYLVGVSETDFNENFVSRPITYLLGNGTGSDPTLNTSNCSATLLGSSRYQRGENMYRYMDLIYGTTHNHSKVIASGVSHNGSAVYQSTEFRNLLVDLLK